LIDAYFYVVYFILRSLASVVFVLHLSSILCFILYVVYSVARKIPKYADLPASYMFQPIAVETTGSINESTIQFLEDLGRGISAISNKERDSISLFQRLSVLLQRFNAILLCDSFSTSDSSDMWSLQ